VPLALDEEEYQEIQACWVASRIGAVLHAESRYLCQPRRNRERVGMTRSISSSVSCVSKPDEFHAVRHAYATNLVLDGMRSYPCIGADTSEIGTEFPTVHEEQTSKRQKRRKHARRPDHPWKSSRTAIQKSRWNKSVASLQNQNGR